VADPLQRLGGHALRSVTSDLSGRAVPGPTTKRKKPKEGNEQVTNRQLTIEYCAPCNYLPRTLWHVHEIVSVLGSEISSVELIPADKGRYHVTLGDDVLFSKEGEGRFPEPSELIDAAMAALRQGQ
jgi:selenoprotein W-related protein